MAYVSDTGKRTAPKRPKPKARVQQAPAGDVISSGGDYGTREAKRYSSTQAFRGAVRKTFQEQTPARQKQITSAVEGDPGTPARQGRIGGGPARPARHARAPVPGPAASAIRDVIQRRTVPHTGGDFSLNLPEQLEQNDIIQTLHRQSTIKSSGDTKSDLELASAESFKGQPEFSKIITDLARKREANKPVPTLASAISSLPLGKHINDVLQQTEKQIPVANFLDQAVSGVGQLIHPGQQSDETGKYPAGWENLPGNLGRQLVDFPAQVIPSTYQGVVVPALHNDVKGLVKNQTQIYSDLYHHPGRTIQQEPLASILAIYGPLKGASNLARTAAVKTGKIPAYRPNATFPNSPLYEVRPTARGFVGAVAQTYKDRFINRGEQEAPTIKTNTSSKNIFSKLGVRGRYNPIEVAAHRDASSMEQIRRIDRETTAELHDRTWGKKPTIGHQLLAQNAVRTIGDMRQYRTQVQNELQQTLNARAKAIEKAGGKRNVNDYLEFIEAQRETLKRLDNFFKMKNPDSGATGKIDDLPDDAEFPHKWQAQTEAFKAGSVRQQELLGELYGETQRLTMRRLAVYAGTPIERGGMGAEHVDEGMLDTDTMKVVSNKEVRDYEKEIGLHDQNISVKERNERQDKVNKKYQTVRNVWKNPNDEILTPDKIREHMKTKPGPFAKKNLGDLLSSVKGLRDRQVEEIDKLHKSGASESDIAKAQFKLNDLEKSLKLAEQGIKVEKTPPSEAGKQALETAQEHTSMHQGFASGAEKMASDFETAYKAQENLAQHVKDKADAYERKPDKAISNTEDIHNHYGVHIDEDLNKNIEDSRRAKQNNDPRLDHLEANLASSIAEKDAMDRANQAAHEGISIAHTEPFSGGTVHADEIDALTKLADTHDGIITTEENIQRARESRNRASTGSARAIFNERIDDLQDLLKSLNESIPDLAEKWREERNAGHVQRFRDTQATHERLASTLKNRFNESKMDSASAAKDLAEAQQLEQDAVKEGTTQENLIDVGKQGLTEPAFISHAPRRSSTASFFVDPTRPQAITPGGYRGTAIEKGLADFGVDSAKQDVVRAAGLITAAEQFTEMLKNVAIRRDPREELLNSDGEVIQPQEPGFPIATYKNKKSVDAVADNWNRAHPDHQVVGVRAAVTKGQQQSFINEANSDLDIAHMAQDAMKDALDGKDIADGGNWVLMPKDYQKQMVNYLHKTDPLVRMISSQFRRTVLGLSIPWFIGNISEASLRAALGRVGSNSIINGKMIEDHLRENDPKLLAQMQTRVYGGGHYGIQRSVGIYTGAEHLQKSGIPAERALGEMFAKLDNNQLTGPPKRLASEMWDHWTDWVFDSTNGRAEAFFQRSMMGRVMRDYTATERRAARKELPLAQQLMPSKLRQITKDVMKDVLDNKLDIRKIDEFGRQVDIMYGKYSKFPPTLKRMIATATPFIAWYLNSVRFIYKTMPLDHPIVTTMLSNASVATEEWRKDHGLGTFLDKHVPPFLQGSVPTSDGGSSRAGRYTPFSVMGDPLGATAGVVFPQFKSIVLNAMGLDWKGDKLPNGDNPFVRTTEMAKSLMGIVVPTYNADVRAIGGREGESTSHHIRRIVGDPFLESKPQGRSSKGGTKYFGGGSSSSQGGTKYFGGGKKSKSGTNYFGGP